MCIMIELACRKFLVRKALQMGRQRNLPSGTKVIPAPPAIGSRALQGDSSSIHIAFSQRSLSMRISIALLPFFAAFTLGAGAVMAQERPATAPAVGTTTPSKSSDCGAGGGMKPHDHASERNAPSTKPPVPCPPAKSAPSAKSKSKPAHDHNSFHKNQ